MPVSFLNLAAGVEELRSELDAAISRVLASSWFILGPEVENFEAAFGLYCGTRYCVSVGSGLDALTLSLRAANIGAGDEVIVPGHTFVATWLAVTAAGAVPVAVDVDPLSRNLDPRKVVAAITPRTAAIIAVHMYGLPSDVENLRSVADRHSLFLLEDAAQAHGAMYRGKRVGSFGNAAAFSFYPGKNLGALGDGGAITTDDGVLAERLRRLRNYGSVVKYCHDDQGVNSRLDEMQAALLSVKLRYLDEWNERRIKLAERYLAAFTSSPNLSLPPDPADVRQVWHLFAVCHPFRERLRTALTNAGIQTLVHYPIPPYRSGAYAQGGWLGDNLAVSDRLASQVLSLPISPHHTTQEVDEVCGQINQFEKSL